MADNQQDATVIVGGRHSANLLLQKKWSHELLLVGDEPHPPYQRPHLSKEFLASKVDRESLYLKPRSVWENAGYRRTAPARCGLRPCSAPHEPGDAVPRSAASPG